MKITLCLTALHIAQSGTDILAFSGDLPLPCLLSSLYMTTGSLPGNWPKFLHECFAHRSKLLESVYNQRCRSSGYRSHSVDEHECTKNNLIR